MIVAETALSLALFYSAPRKSIGDEEMFQFDSSVCHNVLVTDRPATVLFAETMESALAKDFASIPAVRCIFSHNLGNSLLVWIGVDDVNSRVRRWIYDKELALISEFPMFEFDFNIIPTMNRDSKSIVSGEANLIYSRV